MESRNIGKKLFKDFTCRQLQKMARAMRLPSKYKKAYLIELILAKMYKTDLDVCNIIHRVKQERLHLSKVKRQNKTKRSQGFHRNSTNATSSDRVLRSNNLNTVKPNYALMNDTGCKFIPKCALNSTGLKIVFTQNNSSISQTNLTTKCYEQEEMANRITDNSKSVLKPKLSTTNEGDILQNPMPNKNDNYLVEGEPRQYPSLCKRENNARLHRDYTQPLYVQANTSVGINNNHLTNINSNNQILEKIYNIKRPIVPRIIANTDCVNSTQIIVTPTAYQSTAQPSSDALNESFLQTLPSSWDTIETWPGLNALVNMPQIQEAIETLTQDRDYMEQVDLCTRMQCVLCFWAGTKIMLKCHMYKEHQNLIYKVLKSEWNVTFTLESLMQCTGWQNHIVEYDSVLYMLIAKYEDPGCLVANLWALSAKAEPIGTVEITMYNQNTGEPFIWSGQIRGVPPDLSYEQYSDCLRVNLSELALLPDSANLRLVNREFVTESPSTALVGQPVKNDIHIILVVNIWPCLSIKE